MNDNSSNVIRFSTDDFPEHCRLATVCEVYGRTILKHDIEPVGDKPFTFNATLYRLPGLGLASANIGPCRAPRGPQHIDNDDLVFNVSVTGGRLVAQRGREASVRQGEAILTTSADPGVVTVLAPSELISLRIPRPVMSARSIDLDASLVRPIPRSESLSLLSGYLHTILQVGMLRRPDLCDVVVTHIYDLVALTLGANGDVRQLAETRGLRAARRSAVFRLVERRSGDPNLSAVTVATVLGITPRYLHLLLEETGRSFTQHVLQKRLDKAAALLSAAGSRNRKIAEIALDAGFNDLSYFNRTFRSQFGITPTEMRRAAARTEGGQSATPGKIGLSAH